MRTRGIRTLKCKECGSRWIGVLEYKCHYSAFNGYCATPSDWSLVQCCECNRRWRTKALAVDHMFHYNAALASFLKAKERGENWTIPSVYRNPELFSEPKETVAA